MKKSSPRSWVTGLGMALAVLFSSPVCGEAQSTQPTEAPPPSPAPLKVPTGFQVGVYASGVTNGRLMAVGPDGVLYVARQSKGDVVALPDRDKDGRADGMEVVASGLARPHSVAVRGGYLYIATNPTILRVKVSEGKAAGSPEKVLDLPVSTTSHWTRTIDFGPDGKLYVSIGSSCNSCEEEDPRRTAILRYNADGSGEQFFARGLRNALGFDWDPKTGKLWAVDMGQEKLGEDLPPDEINLVEEGKHYGFPYYFGDNLPNPDLPGAKGSLKAADAVPPAFALQAHLSPIGLTFYDGDQFPAHYRTMYVALHGSGSSLKEKIGHKVVRVTVRQDRVVGFDDFVTGFLADGQVLGRPAGLVTGTDGALYISDDNKGFIYRVTHAR
jgi:glucose/arabinose dehydrogenase